MKTSRKLPRLLDGLGQGLCFDIGKLPASLGEMCFQKGKIFTKIAMHKKCFF
jgi:hypothetical protein